MTDSRERPQSDPRASPDRAQEDTLTDKLTVKLTDKLTENLDESLEALVRQPAVAELKQSLNELPDIVPGHEVWARIQARAAPAPGSNGMRTRMLPFAMAAGLILAVGAGIISLNVVREGKFPSELDQRQIASLPMNNRTMNDRTMNDRSLGALRDRSRQLEPIIQGSGATADPVASAVRYRIADLDSQLIGMSEGRLNQQETQRLWSQRVALMESLAEVRRARAASQPAVF